MNQWKFIFGFHTMFNIRSLQTNIYCVVYVILNSCVCTSWILMYQKWILFLNPVRKKNLWERKIQKSQCVFSYTPAFDLFRENMLCMWQLSIKHTMEILTGKKREEKLIKKHWIMYCTNTLTLAAAAASRAE